MEPNDLYEQNQEYIDTIAKLSRDKEHLQKQLDIAKEVLQEFCDDGYFSANKALLEIEELNND